MKPYKKLIEMCCKWESTLNRTDKSRPADLAKAWGVSRGTISLLASGKREITLGRLKFIKQRYKKSWDTIMGLVD